jgi:hypothetical protein
METTKVLGYLEGTDSWLLTHLVARGYGTIPLGNGVDNHGKFIKLITKSDDISLVVAYLHKVVAFPGYPISHKDILYSCKSLNIPVIIIVPKSEQDKAKKILEDVIDDVMLVDPADLLDKALEILEG